MSKSVILLIVVAISVVVLSACMPLASAEPAAPEITTELETDGQQPSISIDEPVSLDPEAPFNEEQAVKKDPSKFTEVKPETGETPPVSQPEPEAALSPTVQKWVNEAKEDLALRQEVGETKIIFISFESKVWPDSGLGCPQPGMNYKQVMSEGYLIVLRIGGKAFNYHGGGGKAPFLCERGTPADKPGSEGSPKEILPPPAFNE